MKKPNISGAGIAEFFTLNGEKMVLGVTVFILLLFLYRAITAKPLDDSRSADAIRQESQHAEARIKEVDFKNSGETVSTTDLKKLVTESKGEVPAAKLQQAREWNPQLFPELTKRPVPDFYPVQDLQIASGHAVIPYTRENAGREPAAASSEKKLIIPATAAVPGVRAPGAEARPAFYAIITGVVPEEKQTLEYKRRFEFAIKPSDHATQAGQQGTSNPTEVPRYEFFKVQRAEVKDANDAERKWVDLDWRALLPDGGKPEANKWAAQYPEIVDGAYIFPPVQPPNSALSLYITWPLPPVYLKYWGLEASNPKVALVKPQGAAAEQPSQPAETEAPASSPFGIPGISGPSGSGGKAGTQPGGPGQKPGVAAGPHPGPPVQRNTEFGPAVAAAAPVRLFRFIDLTAEKGKMYRYRVRLLLSNPNFNLKPEELEKPEEAKSQWSLTPWSEATAAVTVPRESRILADGVIQPRTAVEPMAKIHILTLWNDEKANTWLEMAKEFEIPLGGYAWFKDVKVENVPDMSADELRTVTIPTINADSSMLLDIRNDEALGGGKSKGATEMLFVDGTGKMTIANSGADSPVLKEFQQRTTITPEAAPAKER